MHATWQTLKSGKPQWLTRHPISITLVPIAMMRGHSGKFELFGFVKKDVLFYRFARINRHEGQPNFNCKTATKLQLYVLIKRNIFDYLANNT